jgi:LacI family transcriptional regulator
MPKPLNFAKMPELTAVFAMSDTMALGAIRAIRDHGYRVPEDISVVGFDGIELGKYMSPKLTTIRQNREVIATRSVEILLGNMSHLNGAIHEMVPFQILLGESAKHL